MGGVRHRESYKGKVATHGMRRGRHNSLQQYVIYVCTACTCARATLLFHRVLSLHALLFHAQYPRLCRGGHNHRAHSLTSTRLAVALSSAWGKSTRAAASIPSCAFCSRLASRSRCPSAAWWGAAAACTWSWRCPWRNSPASEAWRGTRGRAVTRGGTVSKGTRGPYLEARLESPGGAPGARGSAPRVSHLQGHRIAVTAVRSG